MEALAAAARAAVEMADGSVVTDDDDEDEEMDMEALAAAARAAVEMADGGVVTDDDSEEDLEYVWDEDDSAVTAADALVNGAPASVTTAVDWNTYTVMQLRTESKARGLPVQGRKTALIAALEQYELEQMMLEVTSADGGTILDEAKAMEAVESFLANGEEPTDDDLRQIEELSPSAAMPIEDYFSKMTIAQLKEELRARNLRVSGKKADLVTRLETYESEKIDYGS
mmetsp:Transcript_25215/g.52441  ORF Transcript_25215/g.52441 Transcript_25215/m.52441 type:complete len:227 (-) Transcript_25215:1279-1959(-)